MSAPDPAPESRPAADDVTLGGYFETHDRPPAYEGPDGHPYTVSLEVERTSNLRAPYGGYLVFPKWAATGVGIVGHVETPVLVECGSEAEAMARLNDMSLLDVQRELLAAVERRVGRSGTAASEDPSS